MKTIVNIQGATINASELWFLNQMAKIVKFMSKSELEDCRIGNVNVTLLKRIAKNILDHNRKLENFVDVNGYFENVEDNHESSSVSSESADGSDTMDAPYKSKI